jgi:hypothetical protein
MTMLEVQHIALEVAALVMLVALRILHHHYRKLIDAQDVQIAEQLLAEVAADPEPAIAAYPSRPTPGSQPSPTMNSSTRPTSSGQLAKGSAGGTAGISA